MKFEKKIFDNHFLEKKIVKKQKMTLNIFNCGPQAVFLPSKLIVRPARWYEFDKAALNRSFDVKIN